MAKDVRLFVEALQSQQSETVFGDLVRSVWDRFAADQPSADFTRIFPYLTDQSSARPSLG